MFAHGVVPFPEVKHTVPHPNPPMFAHGLVPFPEVKHTADPPNPPMFAHGCVPFPESDLTPTIFTPYPDHIQTLTRSVGILDFRP